jgi:hypothetical protein
MDGWCGIGRYSALWRPDPVDVTVHVCLALTIPKHIPSRHTCWNDQVDAEAVAEAVAALSNSLCGLTATFGYGVLGCECG